MVATATKPLNRSTAARDSNIELYRIISMLLIIAHHYVVNSGLTHSGNYIYADVLSPQSQFLLLFGAWGKIGINCFVLITGYFMCKSQITPKKFAKLFFEVMFYQIVISCAFWISGREPFSLDALINALIPIKAVAQNFTGTYLLFFFCIPFLNLLIKHMNEKQHIRLILLLTFIYVLFGTVQDFAVTMNYVSWYAVLYFIASYVRLYPKKLFDSKGFWGVMTLVSVALAMMSVVLCSRSGMKPYAYVTDSNTFLAVLTGLSSFMFFKNVKIKPNKFINAVSATTFGVFLLHTRGDAMREWLWKDVLNNVGVFGSARMYGHAIVSVLLVFTVCSLLDTVRIHLLEKPFFKLWDKCWPKVAEKFTALESRVCKKLGISEE